MGLAAGAVLLAATLSHAEAEPQPALEVQAAILLHQVSRRLDRLGLLMFIKAESDPVGRLAKQLINRVDRIQEDLRELAHSQGYDLDHPLLPEAEQLARDLGQKRARGRLLGASGAEFCREFVKAQYLAVSQMINLSTVLADELNDGATKERWRRHTRALEEISEEVDRIWTDVCPGRD